MSANDELDESMPKPASGFATTHWSIVLAAGQGASPQAREAFAALCSMYWYPVYAFARRRTGRVDDAQDLTQEFFTRLLEKDSLRFADRERGRFRSFLLTSFKNFLSQQRAQANAQKRGGGQSPIPLDFSSGERRFDLEPADELTPEKIYERRWALTLLERVLGRLRDEHATGGKSDLFDALKSSLTDGGTAEGYRQIGAKLGMSEGAVKVAAHRFRRRYGEILREEIGQTVSGPDEIEDELRQLFAAISS
jgi:RNA polymerase sigma-70 factor (ECF subfamily)